MTAGTVTLGIAGNTEAAGWTTIVPRYNSGNPTDPETNSNIIYVSSSTGVDASTGGTLAAPLATVEYAYAHSTVGTLGVGLRSGYPDWLLLKKGDTWTDLVFTPTAGASFQEPQVIASYTVSGVAPTTPRGTATGSRPLIKTHGAAAISPVTNFNAGNINYVAILGIEFYCFDRDPNNVSYNATVGNATSCSTSGSHLTLGGTVTGNFTIGTRIASTALALGTYPTVTGVISGTDHTAGSVLQLDNTYATVSGQTFSAYWEPTCFNLASTQGFLWEDNKITFYNTAFGSTAGSATTLQTNMYLRRNVIAMQYGFNGLGIYCDSPASLIFEDNYFDYNGYNDQIGGFFSRGNNNFNHGIISMVNGQMVLAA